MDFLTQFLPIGPPAFISEIHCQMLSRRGSRWRTHPVAFTLGCQHQITALRLRIEKLVARDKYGECAVQNHWYRMWYHFSIWPGRRVVQPSLYHHHHCHSPQHRRISNYVLKGLIPVQQSRHSPSHASLRPAVTNNPHFVGRHLCCPKGHGVGEGRGG